MDKEKCQSGFEYFSDFAKAVYDVCSENYFNIDKNRTGIMLSSSFGSINTRRKLIAQGMKPGRVFLDNVLIPDNVPSSAVGRTAKKLELNGPCLSLSFGKAGLWGAVYMGAHMIRTGRIDHVLCCHVDYYGDTAPFPFYKVGVRVEKSNDCMMLNMGDICMRVNEITMGNTSLSPDYGKIKSKNIIYGNECSMEENWNEDNVIMTNDAEYVMRLRQLFERTKDELLFNDNMYWYIKSESFPVISMRLGI